MRTSARRRRIGAALTALLLTLALPSSVGAVCEVLVPGGPLVCTGTSAVSVDVTDGVTATGSPGDVLTIESGVLVSDSGLAAAVSIDSPGYDLVNQGNVPTGVPFVRIACRTNYSIEPGLTWFTHLNIPLSNGV